MTHFVSAVSRFLLLLGAVFLAASIAGPQATQAQRTTFTYQGYLEEGGAPAQDDKDLRFALYDSQSGGSQVGQTITKQDVGVADGVFSVELDFGTAFAEAPQYLEVGVRDASSSGSFTALSPREVIRPAPIASSLPNVTVDASGNVGIGTTSPSSRLTVDGPIESISGGVTLPDGTVLTGSDDLGEGGDITAVNTAGALQGGGNSGDVTLRLATSCSSGEIFKWDGSSWACSSDATGGGTGWSLSGNSGTTAGTNFLGTTDETALELKVNGERALRIEPSTDGNGNVLPIANIIGGTPTNSVSSGIEGATISGGGFFDGSSFVPNKVEADYGTVAGGLGNTASGLRAVVGGGKLNTASGRNATTGGGLGNTASGDAATVGGGDGNTAVAEGATVGGGTENEASLSATVGGGDNNSATGINSTVGGGRDNVANKREATVGGGDGNTASQSKATVGGGFGNTASGFAATVPGGDENEAAGNYSLAAGRRAKANSDGTFIWGDSENADFSSTGIDQFLVRAKGGVGLGTNDPAGQLHVQDNLANQGVSDSPRANMVLFENTNDGPRPDVLGLQAGPTDPGSGVTYISFYQRDGTSVGGIEGNGSGGVNYATSGSDYAEELPMRPGAPTASPRDLVAVRGGEVTLGTEGTDRLMIVTDRAAVTGNAAQNSEQPRVPVAFIGQVPVQLNGTAAVGDLIVASGQDDGTARAVSPGQYRSSEHGSIAGRAWSAKPTPGAGTVTVAVGLDQSGALARQFRRQRQTIQTQKKKLKSQAQKIDSLEERLRRVEAKILEK
jgi:hypothetical protein